MSHGLITDRRITRDELLALRDRPVHVVGAASAEGVAVLRLLLGLGFTDLSVHDSRPRTELRRAFRTTHGAYPRVEQDAVWDELRPLLDSPRAHLGDDYLQGIDDAALVALGQGWYLDEDNRTRLVDALGAAGVRTTCMTELYFALHRGPIAAITGTNGKSTTVALAEALLASGEVPMRSAGNERSSRQFLPEVERVAPGTWALLEVSNRQLLQVARSPQVAAITSLTPDHLDEHEGGFAGYRDTKARLFQHQDRHDVAIANADDVEALGVARRSPAAAAGRLVHCGVGDHPAPSVTWRDGVLIAEGVPLARRGDTVRGGTSVLATAGDLRLPGVHNQRNAAVAAALALACGADPSTIAPGLRAFAGKSLRLELLETIDGVEVWSDLKATTPEATCAALSAVGSERRVLLIAGGDDKGLDYAPLARAVANADVLVLAVPGSATDKLASALERVSAGDRLLRVEDLEAALEHALGDAASGDAVIVSPAAAGFWTRQLQGGASLRSLVRRRAAALQEVPDR